MFAASRWNSDFTGEGKGRDPKCMSFLLRRPAGSFAVVAPIAGPDGHYSRSVKQPFSYRRAWPHVNVNHMPTERRAERQSMVQFEGPSAERTHFVAVLFDDFRRQKCARHDGVSMRCARCMWPQGGGNWGSRGAGNRAHRFRLLGTALRRTVVGPANLDRQFYEGESFSGRPSPDRLPEAPRFARPHQAPRETNGRRLGEARLPY
jgi:hypothetical protein